MQNEGNKTHIVTYLTGIQGFGKDGTKFIF